MKKMSIEYWNAPANQLIIINLLLSGVTIALVANLIVLDTNTQLYRIIMMAARQLLVFFDHIIC